MSLQLNQVFEAFDKELEAHRKERVEWLAAGHCTDIAAYREQVGYLRGLARAHSTLTDLVQHQEESDD